MPRTPGLGRVELTNATCRVNRVHPLRGAAADSPRASVVDLAGWRRHRPPGGDPARHSPQPFELVSTIGSGRSYVEKNSADLMPPSIHAKQGRNFSLGADAFDNFRVAARHRHRPQVNLEYLARVSSHTRTRDS